MDDQLFIILSFPDGTNVEKSIQKFETIGKLKADLDLNEKYYFYFNGKILLDPFSVSFYSIKTGDIILAIKETPKPIKKKKCIAKFRNTLSLLTPQEQLVFQRLKLKDYRFKRKLLQSWFFWKNYNNQSDNIVDEIKTFGEQKEIQKPLAPSSNSLPVFWSNIHN